jgi:hypothetical protein
MRTVLGHIQTTLPVATILMSASRRMHSLSARQNLVGRSLTYTHAREVVGSGAAVKESNRNTDTTTESTTYKKQLTTLLKLLTVDMNLGEEAVG